MDVRSEEPYWLLNSGILASYPSLRSDASCDVAVIGGGITGALVAYELVAAGVDTMLLERNAVGAGSTAASTALLQHEPDTELRHLIPLVGEATATRVYRLGLEAIDRLEQLGRDVGDPCGFARRASWYLARGRTAVPGLRREFEARRTAGFDVTYLDGTEVRERSSLKAPAALVAQGDAEVDPFRLTHRLLQRAEQRGLRIHEHSEVSGLDSDGRRTTLRTSRGARVTAHRVVLATGYESESYLRHPAGTLHSTFALITEPGVPLEGWPDRALIWESARPYTYLRTTVDARVVIGGEDTTVSAAGRRDRMLPRKIRVLTRRLRAMFPGIDAPVAYSWAGTFGESRDGLPFIGPCSDCSSAYFALGYGGNGITFGVIAARIITDLHTHRPNADAAIFRFDR